VKLVDISGKKEGIPERKLMKLKLTVRSKISGQPRPNVKKD